MPKRGTELKKTWNNNDLITPPELHAAKAVMCTMWYPRIGFYGEKFSRQRRSSFQPSQLKQADPPTATATRMTKKAIGFCKENDNFARASRLSVHFFVVTA